MIEVLQRVGARHRDPAEVEFHLDQVLIAQLQQRVVRKLAVFGEKFEPVIVVGELDAGFLALLAGAIEGVGGAFPVVVGLAEFFGNPGIHDVALTDDLGRFQLRGPFVGS